MPQLHTAESDENFIQELLPIFDDPRYIRINGRPLLLIYRTELLPDIARTAQTWREAARRRNIDLYLCRVESFTRAEPTGMHFDAACEFPPNALGLNAEAAPQLDFVMQDAQTFPGRIYDYERLVRLLAQRPDPGYKRFLGTTPSWDNTARSGVRGAVFINSSPDLFRHMLTSAVRKTKERFEGDEQIVFINAWNEWAEGAHLEPDKRYGHGFLEACLLALASARDKSKAATADAWETYVPYSVV